MPSPIHCSACLNMGCLVKKCNEDWQEQISKNKDLPVYPKGQYVFQEGGPVLGTYFIHKGKVKVVSANSEGKEQTVRLASDGHILGHMAMDKEVYPISAVTMEDSHICFVDNTTLYEAFMANPPFTIQMMMFYSRELRKSEMRTKCFAQMNIEEKVMYALVYLADTFGISTLDSSIKLSFKRKEIAAIAGTNTEQVSRVISLLKEKQLIKTTGNKIQLIKINQLKKRLSWYFFS